ncbi:DUF883 C-terminal domain-containing protein [Alsobacter sp. SYSU M60028]|uniref:DUF883 C-terminal domain-containing protein n=1 Tax=Alsobacter ponti TaxID=2962936 RepID=A0ABT1L957_9HYPH|nr:DUF883 C-terminal domain-containing protein [Alsobacter ponti]MCP8938022.1 DUF883 C-terminal domain-containing protein [Alsobacter ponti]
MSAGQNQATSGQVTSAFFASQAAASEAVNRLTRAGFRDHEIEMNPVTGGRGVRLTVSAEGDRLGHAMRVLDDDALIRQDERDAARRAERWLPDLGQPGGMSEYVRDNPLLSVGLALLVGVAVGALARRV